MKPRNRIYTRTSIVDRFWKYVQKTDTCWLWTGATHEFGYGVIRNSAGTKPANVKAHRLSWEIHNGPIPDGLNVCHHCDNPPCVNPDHLFLGTDADNVADMIAKGRQVYGGTPAGETHHQRKLTDAQIGEIRSLYATGIISLPELSKYYGVSHTSIDRWIKSAKSEPLPVNPNHPLAIIAASRGRKKRAEHPSGGSPAGDSHHQRKLTNAQIVAIRQRYVAGDANMVKLAAEYGVTVTTIWRWIHK